MSESVWSMSTAFVAIVQKGGLRNCGERSDFCWKVPGSTLVVVMSAKYVSQVAVIGKAGWTAWTALHMICFTTTYFTTEDA